MDNPEYLSSSPTVMSYDYQTGDYFAPAVYGQQTPAQAEAAAVKAVDPIISSIPATAPLVAHPVPGYPKQGHVPQFTMPMNVGEWNIRGINVPTYSPALPPIPGSQWRTAPMPTDAVYSNPALPRRGAYAGGAPETKPAEQKGLPWTWIIGGTAAAIALLVLFNKRK